MTACSQKTWLLIHFSCLLIAALCLPRVATGQESIMAGRQIAYESGKGTLGVKQDPKTGELYVLNREDRCVWRFSRSGTALGRISSAGQGPADLIEPVDFAVDRQGSVIVADGWQSVKVFSSDGRLVRTITHRRPRSVGVLSDGSILVSGFPKDSLISVYDSDGRQVRSIGTPIQTDSDGFLNSVMNLGILLVDESDNIYYIFRHLLKPTVRKYASDGLLLAEWNVASPTLSGTLEAAAKHYAKSKSEKRNGVFELLSGGAVDSATNSIWISSGPFLFQLDTSGKILREVVLFGPGPRRVSAEGFFLKGDQILVATYSGGVLEFGKPK
jgi:hypothetical protein